MQEITLSNNLGIEYFKSENELLIFNIIMFHNDTGFELSMIDWVFNKKLQKNMITSGTQHERIFHQMYPTLRQQVVMGTGKDGYKKWGVKKFTLDFYDTEHKIAYEIDGASHSTKIGRLKDEYRDKFLQFIHGIRTVRYTNKQVEILLLERIRELGVGHFGIDDK
ncbi:DUF559 domain-containing protein [Streptococcus anginosus]|nr:DUF559 domain-containing protein [Streptococcus anginosus]MED5941477.1 DUF559 domain-containing protein [Streptococcus anginosus]MED5970898.1 DUF559 domain-containing protein [Streptococcus anginosus]